jgi:hypothetical protein
MAARIAIMKKIKAQRSSIPHLPLFPSRQERAISKQARQECNGEKNKSQANHTVSSFAIQSISQLFDNPLSCS